MKEFTETKGAFWLNSGWLEQSLRLFDAEDIRRKKWLEYAEKYGEDNSDIWYEQPAANVWVFQRGQKIITLKSHILTGVVTESTEELNEK